MLRLSYTRHTSSCMCVGCRRSPQSLTYVSSRGLAQLLPSCNSNYLVHSFIMIILGGFREVEDIGFGRNDGIRDVTFGATSSSRRSARRAVS
ncbi:hypothetical protein GCT62_21195 [Yersinia enterocolitica]|nr:hypothetical protein [Yersinia enterocolitica]